MLRDVPDEAMPELFDARNCHRVKHASPSPMQSYSDTLYFHGSRKTLNSTEHRTGHFPMGNANCCITFQTHEFLFLFPVGGSTIVTVKRFLFFCPSCDPEQRASQAKWWLRRARPYPRKVQENHNYDSCSWLSPQTSQLKTTSSLTYEAELCPGSPPE